MQEIHECRAEQSIESNIPAMNSGVEMRAKVEVNVEKRTNMEIPKNLEKEPEKKPKKIISERDSSKRPSLSRSMSVVFTRKLKRLSLSTPSSPVSDQSIEVTPSDPAGHQENHDRNGMLKKPPKKTPKQKGVTKGQEEDVEHKKRAYFGLFKRPGKNRVVGIMYYGPLLNMYHLASNMRTLQKSFVIVPTRASLRKSGSKDGEYKPERDNVPTLVPTVQPSAEDVEDPPPENGVRDPSTEEVSTDRTLSAQQQIAPSSPHAKVKRSPTMKERITSLPRRIINKIGVESCDGPECEVDQGMIDKCEIYNTVFI